MFFRMIGIVITLAVVGLMFAKMNMAADQAVSGNAGYQEQQQTLQQAAGVNPADQKQMRDYTMQQAQDIKNYQDQVNQMGDQAGRE